MGEHRAWCLCKTCNLKRRDAEEALLVGVDRLRVERDTAIDHLQRWHVAAHPRGDDSCETCQFLKAKGLPITTPKTGGGR